MLGIAHVSLVQCTVVEYCCWIAVGSFVVEACYMSMYSSMFVHDHPRIPSRWMYSHFRVS